MKKFIITSLIILFFYSAYFDLKVGTLPTSAKNEIEVQVANSIPADEVAYKEIQVQPGETVLTILERIHNGSIPVSIEKAVSEFERLNPDTSAHSIHANKTYRFPFFN
ncbi:hypothetical protein ACTWQL_13130 [Pseudalkalibacillus sp. R45]|uniref:hypothetical protein n=1 Tax=Pseudalkalibacillus sp. R45 TaxID=3457433 RepID=UPI003FCD94D8